MRISTGDTINEIEVTDGYSDESPSVTLKEELKGDITNCKLVCSLPEKLKVSLKTTESDLKYEVIKLPPYVLISPGDTIKGIEVKKSQ